MALPTLISLLIIIVITWVLDDVICLFIWSVSLILLVIYDFNNLISVPSNTINIFKGFVLLLALTAMGKFYWQLRKKHLIVSEASEAANE